MFPEKKKLVKSYHTLLKSDITSFLVSFRRKYNLFPIKELKKLDRQHSYKKVSKIIINGNSMEASIGIKEVKTRFNQFNKKINPSYFNPILKGFLRDANKCENEQEMKRVYNDYRKEINLEFKQFDIDLRFCIDGLKAINRSLREYNTKN